MNLIEKYIGTIADKIDLDSKKRYDLINEVKRVCGESLKTFLESIEYYSSTEMHDRFAEKILKKCEKINPKFIDNFNLKARIIALAIHSEILEFREDREAFLEKKIEFLEKKIEFLKLINRVQGAKLRKIQKLTTLI